MGPLSAEPGEWVVEGQAEDAGRFLVAMGETCGAVELICILDLCQSATLLLPFAVAGGKGADQSRVDQGCELHADS